MSDIHDNVPAHREDAAIANPGLPPHQWRPTDVDPRMEKRAERQVAGFFLLSMLCAVLFLVSYFTFDIGSSAQHDSIGGLGASNVALGLTLGLALLLIGVGVIQWARKLMGDEEIVEMRHPAASSPEDRAATLAALDAGAEESGIGRRPLVRNTLLGAVGILLLPAVVMLRDLGPLPGDKLKHTVWRKGMRVVRDVVGTPIKTSDLEIGDLVNAEPEALFATDAQGEPVMTGVEKQVTKSKAAVVLLRMDPQDIIPGAGPRELVGRRDRLLLEDLHARRLPDLAQRAHHAPPAVPLPPVDVRPRRLGQGHLRPGRPAAAAAAPRR